MLKILRKQNDVGPVKKQINIENKIIFLSNTLLTCEEIIMFRNCRDKILVYVYLINNWLRKYINIQNKNFHFHIKKVFFLRKVEIRWACVYELIKINR